MRAWVQNGYGASDANELQQVSRPEPADDEVLVKVMAAAINHWEWGVLGAPLPVRLVLGLGKPCGRFPILLKSLGYDHAIAFSDVDFTRTGQRYDFILGTRTSRPVADCARALKPGGTDATVGGKKLFRFMLHALVRNGFSDRSFRLVGLKPNINLRHINQLIGAGILQPILDDPYRFEEIPLQLERFRRG